MSEGVEDVGEPAAWAAPLRRGGLLFAVRPLRRGTELLLEHGFGAPVVVLLLVRIARRLLLRQAGALVRRGDAAELGSALRRSSVFLRRQRRASDRRSRSAQAGHGRARRGGAAAPAFCRRAGSRSRPPRSFGAKPSTRSAACRVRRAAICARPHSPRGQSHAAPLRRRCGTRAARRCCGSGRAHGQQGAGLACPQPAAAARAAAWPAQRTERARASDLVLSHVVASPSHRASRAPA